MIDCSWAAQREMVASSNLPDNEKNLELKLIDLQEEYENQDITKCIHTKIAKMIALYKEAHPNVDFSKTLESLY